MIRAIFNYLFKPRFYISRVQLNLFATVFLATGIVIGFYITISNLIPQIFASANSSVVIDTDTEFSQGTTSSTTVSGSGTAGVVKLTPSGPNSTIYKKTITVNNSSNSSTLSNYQVSFTTDTSTPIAAGHMNSDCSDIRFRDSDDSTSITNYWIESGCNTSSTKIWVKIPSLSGSANRSLYMYYGNSSLTTQSSVANTFIDDISGVLGSYSMDESSGTSVADSSGNSNNATANGTTVTSSGKFSNARLFAGGSDYVAKTNTGQFDTTNLTLEAWVYPTWSSNSNGFNPTILALRNGGPTRLSMHMADNYSGVILWNGSNVILESTFAYSFSANNWYHIVMTYQASGTLWTFNVNGSQITTSNAIGLGTTGQPFVIGSHGTSSPGEPWIGRIDEARIYSSTLTSGVSSNVANLYNNYGYATSNYTGHVLVRKYSSPEPSTSIGSEASALPSSGTWTSPTNSNVIDLLWNGGWGDGTSGSTAFTATVATVTSNDSIQFQMRSATTTGGLSSATYYTLGTATSGTTLTVTKANMPAGLATGSSRYLQVLVTFTHSTASVSQALDDFTINYLSDDTAPNNPSSITMTRSNGGTSVASQGWTNNLAPYFSWTAGSDSDSGVQGYCLYLGQDAAGTPESSVGLLGTSPSTVPTIVRNSLHCDFFTTSTSVDFATTAYRGATWLTSALSTASYYVKVETIDNNGYMAGSATSFRFNFDSSVPTNVTSISVPGSTFSSVADMNFSWPPESSGTIASDTHSGVLGYQYAIVTSGAAAPDVDSSSWIGSSTSSGLGITYIPDGMDQPYYLTQLRDGTYFSTTGTKTIYFRTVDTAGNYSTTQSYRTGDIRYGGQAPTFGGGDSVSITPSSSTENSFALSWPAATAQQSGKTVAGYYYMINTTPPSYDTLIANESTYIPTGTTRSVAAGQLPNVHKGSDNIVYVVAIDNADPPNYSPSTYISGTFTLNSTDPNNVENLVASDSSIKSQSQWKVTLSWTAPTYQGAGNLTYLVYRSSDGSTFSQVGTTSGLSYVDTTPESQTYYYKVYTKDGANATSSGTNAVSILPTGKWTSAPTLDSGPTVSSITTKKATITWSTSRGADSSVAYGTKSGSYNSVEASNRDLVTSHSITLSGLTAGTVYYYKAKWADEDGNKGESDEKTFTTTAAPAASNVKATDITLTSGVISFTVSNASKVTIEYGKSTSYGGSVSTTTSGVNSTYAVKLTDLQDGTIYHYHLVMEDGDGNKYNSDDYIDLVTPPSPRISTVRIQQVSNTAQPTLLISWITNTEISSIVTYYPQSDPSASRDQVNIALLKGNHQMIITGLYAETEYNFIVKGRDKLGNEAVSDIQVATTATDTRPPAIKDLQVQGTTVLPIKSGNSNNDSTSQLVVSWNTDEPSTSQVEFSQGAGGSYSQRTQEDNKLGYNHLVIISNLAPSTVYHIRALSKDKAGNIGKSGDNVTITPKATANALNLVISNLQDAFSFLGILSR